MINERKMTAILVGVFMISMVSVLMLSFRKKTPQLTDKTNGPAEQTNKYADIAESVHNKFLSALAHSEKRFSNVKSSGKTSSEISGELGLFL